MPFKTRAQAFIEHPESIEATQEKREIMVESVKFLLENNHIGHKNTVSTDTIIEHLNEVGYDINKGPWETNILGKLRDNEIWLGSKLGSSGGIFIIENKNDAEIVKKEYGRKYETMMKRYKILEKLEEEFN